MTNGARAHGGRWLIAAEILDDPDTFGRHLDRRPGAADEMKRLSARIESASSSPPRNTLRRCITTFSGVVSNTCAIWRCVNQTVSSAKRTLDAHIAASGVVEGDLTALGPVHRTMLPRLRRDRAGARACRRVLRFTHRGSSGAMSPQNPNGDGAVLVPSLGHQFGRYLLGIVEEAQFFGSLVDQGEVGGDGGGSASALASGSRRRRRTPRPGPREPRPGT